MNFGKQVGGSDELSLGEGGGGGGGGRTKFDYPKKVW